MSTRHKISWLFAATLVLGAPGAAAQMGADFNNAQSGLDCDAVVERYKREVLSYGCYLSLARRTRDYATVQRHLEARLAVHPDDHAARMNLGRLLADQSNAAAVEHYEQALAGFQADKHHEGAVYALYMMSYYSQVSSEFDEADRQLAEADREAFASDDRSLQARVKQWRASLAITRNDYAGALVLAKEAEQLAFPDGSLNARVAVLGLLGSISNALGRPDMAIDYHRREAEAIGDGSIQWLAKIHINIADLSGRVRVPRRYTKEEQIEFARQALDTASRAGHGPSEATARVILGRLLDGPEAKEHFQFARDLYRKFNDGLGVASALWGLAWETYWEDPDKLPLALAMLEEADKLSRRAGGTRHVAVTAIQRAELQWVAGQTETATAASFTALDHIERFRDLQRDDTVRARLFGPFAPTYARFVDAMMAAGDLESAFFVGERMRSRVLLDRLDTIRHTGDIAEDNPQRHERDAILERIAAVQRQLLDSGLSQVQRDGLLRNLEQLEVDEISLREALGDADTRFAALRRPSFPSLNEVQDTLAPDEALLVFHFGREPTPETKTWRAGGRLLVITNDKTWAAELLVEKDLPTRIDAFNELLQQRSGFEAPASVSLYEDLLEQPLRDLPDSIRRLIVIPDGPVSRLPVGALRSGKEEPPLVSRFDLVTAPSVTLWMRWRQASTEPAAYPALVFADPELPSDDDVAEYRAVGVFGTPVELGPLPQARREGRAVVRHLGGASRLLVGADASEAALKELPIGDYRLLHFAAHAIVDDAYPERSAVVLAPGAETEDGLLQPREIATLDLSGSVVILSACRSAGGELLPGEGVLGLARAFFQGGAHAVVGSLWPLRDDEAAALVDDVSRRLRQGMTLSRAVAETQRRWIREGRPTAAWSGLVVLGYGDVVLLPGGAPSRLVWWLAPLLVLAVVTGWAIYRSRARQRA